MVRREIVRERERETERDRERDRERQREVWVCVCVCVGGGVMIWGSGEAFREHDHVRHLLCKKIKTAP